MSTGLPGRRFLHAAGAGLTGYDHERSKDLPPLPEGIGGHGILTNPFAVARQVGTR
jgi:hypothetical protein